MDDRARWPLGFHPEQSDAVRLGEKLKGGIFDFWNGFAYGPHMVIDGYLAEPGADEYEHRFGGRRWQIASRGSAGGQSVVLLTLDLRDPRLSALHRLGLDELPLAHPLNWLNSPDGISYRVDPERRVVDMGVEALATAELPTDEFLVPNPLPETRVRLPLMTMDDYPVDSDSYYRIWRELEGSDPGSKFIRVLDPPLWIQNPIEQTCACGAPMRYIASTGSDNRRQPAPYLPAGPFDLGEGALYCVLCEQCPRILVEQQST